MIGRDIGVVMPCGCAIIVDDDGIHIRSCDDPEHERAHRETSQEIAARKGMGYTEIPENGDER